jgi:hypothetical protein
MGAEGRDHQLEEHPGVGMAQPQQPGDGKATPRPWLRRLATCFLSGRGLRPRAPRALDETGAMALPPPFVQGGWLPSAAEALQEAGEEVERQFGTSLTVGRRTAPQA